MKEYPDVVTSIEAAQYLRLDADHQAEADMVNALYRIVRTGKLNPIRGLGKSYKFTLDELRRYVAAETGSRDMETLCDQHS